MEISAVAPGVFKRSRDGSKVYFVENYSGEAGSATNLFVRSIENGKTSLVFAREGIVRTEPNGERYLYLTDGRRYEGEAEAADWKVVELRKYKVKINQNIRTTVDTRTKSVPSGMLWLANTPDARAELAWRVSMPIASLILAYAGHSAFLLQPAQWPDLQPADRHFSYTSCTTTSWAWCRAGSARASCRSGRWSGCT